MTSTLMKTIAKTALTLNLEQQHSKPISSPTKSLDEGFESDPDRISSDSEQPTSGTANSKNINDKNKIENRTIENVNAIKFKQHQLRNLQLNQLHQNADSTLTQLSSAVSNDLSSSFKSSSKNNNNNNMSTNLIQQQHSRLTDSSSIIDQQQKMLQNYYKDRRGSIDANFTMRNNLYPQRSASFSTTTEGLRHSYKQYLHCQNNGEPVAPFPAVHHTVNAYRKMAQRSVNGCSNGNFRQSKTRSVSPLTINATNERRNSNFHNFIAVPSHTAKRSNSLDVTSNYWRLKHKQDNHSSNYGRSSIPSLSSQTLLLQPMSSVSLNVHSSNMADSTSALTSGVGISPVIASSTNSLYTFYPAEGNLQILKSKCGDLAYTSSHHLQTPPKAPVSWTQSITRQTRRFTKSRDSELPKKVRFNAFATVKVV